MVTGDHVGYLSRTGEHGTVAHAEVTLCLVTLPVSPG